MLLVIFLVLEKCFFLKLLKVQGNSINKKNNMIYVTMTVKINELKQLRQLTNQLNQIPNIVDIKRTRE